MMLPFRLGCPMSLKTPNMGNTGLWVIENMFNAGILSTVQVVAALEAMRDDPRCPVPKCELTVRIRRLKV